MSQTFLCADGRVVQLPDAADLARARRSRSTLLTTGQLCTACLVGTWPMSLLRAARTRCDTCRDLDAEVARRAGLDHGTTAGLPAGAPVWIVGSDLDGADGDPVRLARALRQRRLDPVFHRARALGLAQLWERGAGEPPVEVVALDDLDRHDLIPADAASRIRRFAVWLETLDPDGYPARAAALADVDGLAAVLTARARAHRRARARARFEQAVADAVQVPRALTGAALDVLRAHGAG